MNDDNILSIQKECWDYLTTLSKNNPNFYFVPRQTNRYGRLEMGYHFIGNDYYMQVSFWKGFDDKKRYIISHLLFWKTAPVI